MTKTARERLARLLGDSEPAGSFSAQLLAPAHFLQLEVSGAGPVTLPVRAPLAKKLVAVARPAMFGRAEETLTDTSVRDTWELTPDQITLGGPGWTALMEGALEHFRDELGLPRTSRLRAELHSMLVYGKGQFFLPHQDSEKDDAMVGTLVVSLPSAHTGGELVIDHAGQINAYRASKEELTFVAFYADCRHQVTPVRSGYRVTLTFNLLSAAEAQAPEADPAIELVHCLTEHFTTPVTRVVIALRGGLWSSSATIPGESTPDSDIAHRRKFTTHGWIVEKLRKDRYKPGPKMRGSPHYGSRDLGPPNRLVFLLDHEYTQRGLSWRRLKGRRRGACRSGARRGGAGRVRVGARARRGEGDLGRPAVRRRPAGHTTTTTARTRTTAIATRTPPTFSSMT